MAERYVRASKSSHLKLEPEPGDVDVIIAAGLADSLGTLLLRCRQEWDAQRSELARMEALVLRNQAEAERTGKRQPREAQHQFYEAMQALSVSRALAMMGMGTLPHAMVALQRHATAHVLRRGLEFNTAEIADLVGDALDVWLDQRCNTCFGTKETGVFGGPRAICSRCKGTGLRRRALPSTVSGHRFLGEWLIAEADRLVHEAERRMGRALR